MRKLAAWFADALPGVLKHAFAVLVGAVALGVATAMGWIDAAVAYVIWLITFYVAPVLAPVLSIVGVA